MLPAGVFIWDDFLDPSDKTDYVVDFSGLLEDGEFINTYTISKGAEAILYGLEYEDPPNYNVSLTGGNRIITLWLYISGSQTNPDFVTGVYLPLELTVTTNSIPRRIRQRTVAVKVIQR